MITNISSTDLVINELSTLFKTIGQSTRLNILLALGKDEVCVCHLENILGIRQAAISQHLMMLRKANIVETHRIGRNIFYSLVKPELFDLLIQVSHLLGLSETDGLDLSTKPFPNCPCPQCNPGLDSEFSCSDKSSTINKKELFTDLADANQS
ncbi:MAG: ArsR/SmtB family transcription factor [Bellilinea sp.]